MSSPLGVFCPIGPFTAIYQVWSTGTTTGSKASTHVWALVFGVTMLVIGSSASGYSLVMRVLGDIVTSFSFPRVLMELGAAITVILASQCGFLYRARVT
ncbi:hypothetical protein MPER_09893 [Moniliophthora perniciosa FA553]|nr:hypothetical protein MPER_09893 [Moniliophthora perniciosa FA553]